MKTGRVFRYTTLPPLLQFLSQCKLTLLPYRSWEDKNDVHFLEQFANRTRKRVYAMCLTHADETFHHWKVFAKGDAGVRITFDKEELVRWAHAIPGMRAGDVVYKTIEQVREAPPTTDELPFLKRYPYRGEEEVRLIYATDVVLAAPPAFDLDLKLVRRVTLSPWLARPLRDAVADAVNKSTGGTRIEVSRSTLVDNDEWKKLADVDV